VAANLQLPLQAVLQSSNRRPEVIDGLQLSYIGNEVELNSRSLPFYVPLENKVERSEDRGGRRYLSWLFKPGQRLQVRVPHAALDRTFVVPRDAVAEDGVERYVFVDHGDHFERRPVQVLAQDSISYALAHDGSIDEGERIAMSGAHQLQMAFKQAAGGPIDPHAGHTH
jgi:multidrug efflux pump subunit AcrA (membrane-fusion protein)